MKDPVVHRAFLITVIVNGAIALGDFAVGLVFLFEKQISAIANTYHGTIAHLTNIILNHVATQDQHMGMLYFFSHSIVKLFLTWGLLTNRLWAYPLAIIFLSGFGIYQLIGLFSVFSLFTLALIIVNAVTVYFIAREYRSL